MATKAKRSRPPHRDILTPAEWRTVHAAQHGLSNRQIANRHGVSLDAVKFHIANAVSKVGLNDKQALKQWFAVPRNSALGARKITTEPDASFGPIGQISRSVSDLDRSSAWYRGVMKLRHLYTFGNLAFFDCGGTRLFLEECEGDLPDESVIYFRVPDIARAYENLRGRHIGFTSAPHHPPARRRYGRVDGILHRSGQTAAGDHVAGRTLIAARTGRRRPFRSYEFRRQ